MGWTWGKLNPTESVILKWVVKVAPSEGSAPVCLLSHLRELVWIGLGQSSIQRRYGLSKCMDWRVSLDWAWGNLNPTGWSFLREIEIELMRGTSCSWSTSSVSPIAISPDACAGGSRPHGASPLFVASALARQPVCQLDGGASLRPTSDKLWPQSRGTAGLVASASCPQRRILALWSKVSSPTWCLVSPCSFCSP